jgi:SAM-dependent methyltransferase
VRRGPLALGLRRLARPAWPAALTRREPLSRFWGFDRGTPIDRYYIERFLQDHTSDIRGAVLEVQNRAYTDRFGIEVMRSEVLDVDPENPLATIVADLASADALPDASFDCFILTQTLHLIYDVHGAVAHAHRLLRRGGVLLATVPAASRVVGDPTSPLDYWRFTTSGCRRLFADAFGGDQLTVRSHGNLSVVVAFLRGMAYEELPRRRLDDVDPRYPLLISVRAVKG